MALKEYKAKRDFTRTREPSGEPRTLRRARQLIFVVQKHAASHLHYDFRLEMEGVLKSWAVPKGFPTKRGDRRLAIEVEDHPFNYKDFEGTIPKGNYGAGTVMVWDRGTYDVFGTEPLAALREGKLHVKLNGKKLIGEWTLVRMRPRDENAKPQWLLLKSGADLALFSQRQEDNSALSGRSMEEIAGAGRKHEWQSNRTARSATRLTIPKPKPPKSPTSSSRDTLRSLPSGKPRFVEPMKATLVESLPRTSDWVYEIKFDGIRALAVKDGKSIRLHSRNEKELTAKYDVISEALEELPAKQAVIDGEIVAVDEHGRSSFQLLQTYHNSPKKPPLLYYVFDVLNLNGKELTGLTLCERKTVAESLVSEMGPRIRFSAGIEADSQKVIRQMQAQGLEGLVAKRKDSVYEAGRRSGNWLKFKWSNQQEFVIGGYTEPKGGRPHFGAILVGYYERGKLLFAAKVGTGFDEKGLASLYQKSQKLIRRTCPFANLPEDSGTSRGLTASQMRLCTWLEPKLVCEVRFAEWTRDGHLRQPVFLGLREDKDPGEVIRERSG